MLRIVDGTLKRGDKIRFLATKTDYEVTELGSFQPFPVPLDEIGPGEVGFIAANIKSVHDTNVGDTVTHAASMPNKGPHHLGPTTDPLLIGRLEAPPVPALELGRLIGGILKDAP